MKKIIAALVLLAALGLFSPAEAQGVCPFPLSSEELAQLLERDYGETLVFAVITDAGGVLEFYMNDETATWTILGLSPVGCVTPIASGQGYVKYRKTKQQGDDA